MSSVEKQEEFLAQEFHGPYRNVQRMGNALQVSCPGKCEILLLIASVRLGLGSLSAPGISG